MTEIFQGACGACDRVPRVAPVLVGSLALFGLSVLFLVSVFYPLLPLGGATRWTFCAPCRCRLREARASGSRMPTAILMEWQTGTILFEKVSSACIRPA